VALPPRHTYLVLASRRVPLRPFSIFFCGGFFIRLRSLPLAGRTPTNPGKLQVVPPTHAGQGAGVGFFLRRACCSADSALPVFVSRCFSSSLIFCCEILLFSLLFSLEPPQKPRDYSPPSPSPPASRRRRRRSPRVSSLTSKNFPASFVLLNSVSLPFAVQGQLGTTPPSSFPRGKITLTVCFRSPLIDGSE